MATQLATTDSTALATYETEHFALRQRQARMFAMSLLVPQHLRNGTPEQAMANCYVALALAEAMGEMPLIVMQNIHFINGKAGFATKYMIARANASGKFKDDLDWEVTGKGDALSLTCFAHLAKSGKRVEMTADMAMAKAEGWSKNAKYQTMPEVMLRYRSASFLVNMYAPEVMLGYKTAEEYEDMGAVAANDIAEPLTGQALLEQARGDEPDLSPQPATPLPAEAEPLNNAGDAAAPAEGTLVDRMAAVAERSRKPASASQPEGRADEDMGEKPTLDQAKAALDDCGTEDAVVTTLDSYRGQLSEEDLTALSGHAANIVAARWPG